jgi:hypothetical protein
VGTSGKRHLKSSLVSQGSQKTTYKEKGITAST